MRCYCCNNILTPQEATRRFKLSNEFTDTCSGCLREISDDAFTETVEGRPEDEDVVDDEGNFIDDE
jgi:hypothetical protein